MRILFVYIIICDIVGTEMECECVFSRNRIELAVLEEVRVHLHIFEILAAAEYEVLTLGKFSSDAVFIVATIFQGFAIDFEVQTLLLGDGESHRAGLVVELKSVIARFRKIPLLVRISVHTDSVFTGIIKEIPLACSGLLVRAIPRAWLIQIFTVNLEAASLEISAPGGFACLLVNIHLIFIQIPTEIVSSNPEPFSTFLKHLELHCVGVEYESTVFLRVVLSAPLLYLQRNRLVRYNYIKLRIFRRNISIRPSVVGIVILAGIP